ncbi:MAG: CoA-binding protein [Saprospiraceae bacterium]
MKKTLVLGASPNPERYSYLAVKRLLANGHDVIPVGNRKNASINDLEIKNGKPSSEDVHTVTLYLNPDRQKEYYDYILSELNPDRIIFNPGTVNPELIKKANDKGIETVVACTLVMLSTDQY